MNGKSVSLYALAAALPAVGLVAAYTMPGLHTLPPLSGRVAYVTRGTIITSATPSGVLQDMSQFNLNFPVSGTVAQVLVTAGQHVKAGQELALLTYPTLQNTINADQIALRIAQANFAKLQAGPTAATLEVARTSFCLLYTSPSPRD